MFEGFTHQRITTPDAEIDVLMGGHGKPLLLLHGFPQNHVTWHRVAPELAQHFTVVVPDLPGYGDSSAPEPQEDHRPHSKRSFADTLMEMMARLGFIQFAIVGHDRGGRVAYRMALDHPQQVTRLATLDIVPTLDTVEFADCMGGFFNWYFLAQPAPLPETLIAGSPDFYLDYIVKSWLGRADGIDPAAMAAYRQSFHKPSVIRAMCEEYRAGMTVDLEHDRADRAAGTRIACPVLALWSKDLTQYDPLAIWKHWANDVTGQELDSGHFMMEEAPDKTLKALLPFLMQEGMT
jgi:haloacetate dehalogenase